MGAQTEPYEDRFYRRWMHAADLVSFGVRVRESDLMILADRALEDEALDALREVRSHIESYIARDPAFASALEPCEVARDAPGVIHDMAMAGRRWGVGPMAAVAGAVAGHVGRRLLDRVENVIVENGGDVFVRLHRPVTFRLYAGEGSPFKDRVGFTLHASEGLGVCTSSGVVGPSLSFGRADAVVAIGPDATDADAAATALANRVKRPSDVDAVVASVKDHGGLTGIVACMGNRIGFFGDIEIESTRRQRRTR